MDSARQDPWVASRRRAVAESMARHYEDDRRMAEAAETARLAGEAQAVAEREAAMVACRRRRERRRQMRVPV